VGEMVSLGNLREKRTRVEYRIYGGVEVLVEARAGGIVVRVHFTVGSWEIALVQSQKKIIFFGTRKKGI